MAREEKLESLPPHDREQGYLGPEPREGFQDGVLSDDEQDAFDQRREEWEQQAKAVAEREDKIAKERAKAAETEQQEAPAKAPAKSGGTGGSSSG